MEGRRAFVGEPGCDLVERLGEREVLAKATAMVSGLKRCGESRYTRRGRSVVTGILHRLAQQPAGLVHVAADLSHQVVHRVEALLVP